MVGILSKINFTFKNLILDGQTILIWTYVGWQIRKLFSIYTHLFKGLAYGRFCRAQLYLGFQIRERILEWIRVFLNILFHSQSIGWISKHLICIDGLRNWNGVISLPSAMSYDKIIEDSNLTWLMLCVLGPYGETVFSFLHFTLEWILHSNRWCTKLPSLTHSFI